MAKKKPNYMGMDITVGGFDKFLSDFNIVDFSLPQPAENLLNNEVFEIQKKKIKRHKENYERFRRVDTGEAPIDAYETYQYKQGRAYTGRDYGGYYAY